MDKHIVHSTVFICFTKLRVIIIKQKFFSFMLTAFIFWIKMFYVYILLWVLL